MRVLGIETSCDETAAAVIEDGSVILSNVVVSQAETHARYGGIVPELASRQHMVTVVPAVRQALDRLTEEDAKVRILHAACGNVTESDVLLASASTAIVLGFNVGTETSADRLALRMGVQIRHYQIIYQLIDDVSLGLHGMLEPEFTEIIVGHAEIREIFPSRRGIRIAGCRVLDGRITRGATVRVLRSGAVVHDSPITSLRHFRDEVNEATAGTECGIILQGFNEFEEGDVIESHRQERERR